MSWSPRTGPSATTRAYHRLYVQDAAEVYCASWPLKRHDPRVIPRELCQCFAADIQGLHHHVRWAMGQPVGQRDLSVTIGFEEPQHHKVGVPDVFHIMAQPL